MDNIKRNLKKAMEKQEKIDRGIRDIARRNGAIFVGGNFATFPSATKHIEFAQALPATHCTEAVVREHDICVLWKWRTSNELPPLQ